MNNVTEKTQSLQTDPDALFTLRLSKAQLPDVFAGLEAFPFDDAGTKKLWPVHIVFNKNDGTLTIRASNETPNARSAGDSGYGSTRGSVLDKASPPLVSPLLQVQRTCGSASSASSVSSYDPTYPPVYMGLDGGIIRCPRNVAKGIEAKHLTADTDTREDAKENKEPTESRPTVSEAYSCDPDDSPHASFWIGGRFEPASTVTSEFPRPQAPLLRTLSSVCSSEDPSRRFGPAGRAIYLSWKDEIAEWEAEHQDRCFRRYNGPFVEMVCDHVWRAIAEDTCSEGAEAAPGENLGQMWEDGRDEDGMPCYEDTNYRDVKRCALWAFTLPEEMLDVFEMGEETEGEKESKEWEFVEEDWELFASDYEEEEVEEGSQDEDSDDDVDWEGPKDDDSEDTDPYAYSG